MITERDMKEVEAAAQELIDRIHTCRRDKQTMEWLTIVGSPKTAAIRRQSMELTRLLAQMRKS